jgi:multidrug efflux pump subunit AcrA (membrane-fusion protein)
MKRTNTGPILSFLLLIAVVGLSGCSNEQSHTAPSPETVRNISVLAVQQASVPDLLEATGTVRAAQTSDAASQMMGNIVEIRAHEGDHVQRGQVLAVIDDSQPRAAVDRSTAADLAAQQQLVGAESDLALTDSTLKRYQTLFEKKSVSPQEFDEVKARQPILSQPRKRSVVQISESRPGHFASICRHRFPVCQIDSGWLVC